MKTVSKRSKVMVVAVLICGLLAGCSDDCDPVLRGFKSTVEAVTQKVSGQQDSEASAEDTVTGEALPAAPVTEETVADDVSVNIPVREPLADDTAAMATTDDVSVKYRPLETLEDYKNNKDRQPLNLSLPAMYWDKNPGVVQNNGILPDVFQPMISDPRMNLSGRLHWDESEEAKNLSVEDTITGAEVELQFRLP